MSSPNLEGLEIKEATPSIAPSIYESLIYTRKWRILLAIVIGLSLLAICVIGFYLGLEKNDPNARAEQFLNTTFPSPVELEGAHWLWRSTEGGQCMKLQSESCPEDFGERILLVISLGGLRPDQVSTIPAFVEMKRCGISASSLVPSYPSLDLPNLYTIATGLYPEFHGIVNSEMDDPDFCQPFKDSANNRTWWGGEPIWNTVNEQGKRSAAYLWPGSNVSIQARYPSYWQSESVKFSQRMAKVLEWIKLPKEERPHLIMLYYDEPVQTAQTHGIFSDDISNILYEIGVGLDELLSSLHRMEIFNCVDLIVLSDHGVVPFNCDDSIYADFLLNDPNVETVYTGPIGRAVFSQDTNKAKRQDILDKYQCRNNKLQLLAKRQVPTRYHYTYSDRIGDILLDTKVGLHVTLEGLEQECLAGQFGYNNIEPSMQGVFMAHGSSFKSNYTTESFRNIEIYNLMCNILGINASPNNGTDGALLHLMADGTLKRVEQTLTFDTQPFLREVLRLRPNRIDDVILGINGKVDETLKKKCSCEQDINVKHSREKELPVSVTTDAEIKTTHDKKSTSTATTTTTSTTMMQQTTVASTTTDKTTTKKASTSPETTATTPKMASTQESDPPTATLSVTDKSTTPPPPPITTTATQEEIGSVSPQDSSITAAEPTSDDTESTNRRIRSVPATSLKFVKEDDNHKINEIKRLHSPWGLPKYSAPEVSNDIVNVLLHTNYILGFPESLNLAIYVSYSLTKEHLNRLKESMPVIPEGLDVDPKDIKKRNPVGCWVADPRLSRSKSDQCHRNAAEETLFNPTDRIRQLYPEELETSEMLSSEGFLLSNAAPMKKGYEKKGRKAILKAIQEWAELKGAVNVLHGPIFDYDHDGVKDDITHVRDTIKPLMASHYFYVVTSCNSSVPLEGCPLTDMFSQAFVLPNTHQDEGCHMTDKEYLKYHLCSIADIEKLSGLRLFRNIEPLSFATFKSIQHITLLT